MLRHPRKLRQVLSDPRPCTGTIYLALWALAELARPDGVRIRVFSQDGEHGVVAEIVRRIGPECPRTFLELGAGAELTGTNALFVAEEFRERFADLGPWPERAANDELVGIRPPPDASPRYVDLDRPADRSPR